jgi:hypothetical protein
MTEQEQEFLNELTALTHKYRVVIGGCGCCGSPSINPLDNESLNGNPINAMQYTVDEEGYYLTFEEKNVGAT